MKPSGNNKETPAYDIITIGGAEYKLNYIYALIADSGPEGYERSTTPAIISGFEVDKDGRCLLKVSYIDTYNHRYERDRMMTLRMHAVSDAQKVIAEGTDDSISYVLLDLHDHDDDAYERMLNEYAYRVTKLMLRCNTINMSTNEPLSHLADKLINEYNNRIAKMPYISVGRY